MAEVMGYVVLAGVAGVVSGYVARMIRDERKNREFLFWLERQDRTKGSR